MARIPSQSTPDDGDAHGQMGLFDQFAPTNSQLVRGPTQRITPEWHSLVSEFLVESEHLYPGIEKWWSDKVVPGLDDGRRLCRMIAVDGEVAALAIAKVDIHSSKLCTLRVRPKFQGLGLGQQLIRSTFASLLERQTGRIHFTISEEINHECGSFFEPYGFKLGAWKRGWYVRGMYEMAYWAKASRIRDALSHQLPLFGERPVVVMSIKPEYALAMGAGHKQVEFRRKFTDKVRQATALFYVTAPVQEFRLSAAIADVVRGSPDDLWSRFGSVAGCDESAFRAYFEGADSGYAIALSSIQRLASPLHTHSPALQELKFRPPQSFAILPSSAPLVRAVVGV